MRRIVAALGIVAIALGLVALGGIRFGLSLSEGILVMVGLLAGIQGIRSIQARRGTEFKQAQTGEPERRYQVPTPGDGFPSNIGEDDQWDRLMWENNRLIAHLRQTAIETLVLRGGFNRDEAETAVERGTWTDDPVAAGFVGGEDVSIPVRERVRELTTGQSSAMYRANRTINALAEVQDGD